MTAGVAVRSGGAWGSRQLSESGTEGLAGYWVHVVCSFAKGTIDGALAEKAPTAVGAEGRHGLNMVYMCV